MADGVDCNPDSDLRTTIFIGTIDMGVPNTVFENECTRADLIAQLAASAATQGDFTTAVDLLTDQWVLGGLITDKQKGVIMRAAARFRIA